VESDDSAGKLLSFWFSCSQVLIVIILGRIVVSANAMVILGELNLYVYAAMLTCPSIGSCLSSIVCDRLGD